MRERERSFADLAWENKRQKTRREKLLGRMEMLIPWEKMVSEIMPYYGGAGKGRVPYPLESVMRVHCVQVFYSLSDPAMEDLLYEAESVRRFTGLEMGKLLDKSTISNFPHLLESHGFGVKLLEIINEHLEEQGLRAPRKIEGAVQKNGEVSAESIFLVVASRVDEGCWFASERFLRNRWKTVKEPLN